MKLKLPVEPFDKVYVNCVTNSQLSILPFYEPSYKNFVLTNDYEISFSDYEKLFFPYAAPTKAAEQKLIDCFNWEVKQYDSFMTAALITGMLLNSLMSANQYADKNAIVKCDSCNGNRRYLDSGRNISNPKRKQWLIPKCCRGGIVPRCEYSAVRF